MEFLIGDGMNYLVLVNKQLSIKYSYLGDRNLLTIYNELGEKVQIEEETYDHFLKLKEYLKSIGINIGIDDAFRSIETQQKIRDEYLEKYGEEFTDKYVANPEESEHHTGLAVDLMLNINGEFIRDDDILFAYEEIFTKIHNVLYEYGFILRYPKDKENITGYSYEPWHIRYVGENFAKIMFDNNLTLEEFLCIL